MAKVIEEGLLAGRLEKIPLLVDVDAHWSSHPTCGAALDQVRIDKIARGSAIRLLALEQAC